MASSKKRIDCYQVIVETESELKFQDILELDCVSSEEYSIRGKEVGLTILENTSKYIVGIMSTLRDDNVPPKKEKRKKKFQRIGLNGAGLAYGNVFLFEKKRGLLLYEVNKFGCHVEHFILFLYRCCREDEDFSEQFAIKLNPVLKKDEYTRMKNMEYHKQVEIAVANPTEILKDYEGKHGSLFHFLKSGKETHSKRIAMVFNAKAKTRGGTGLASKPILEIIDDATDLMQGISGGHIEKLLVEGYVSENGKSKLQYVDLLADRFWKEIKLNEPKENSDLLEAQREKAIKEVYSECIDDFKAIFGS